MTNGFYNHSTPLTKHTLARAEAVNAEFDAIAAGLDKLPTEDEIKQGRTSYGTDSGVADAYVITMPYGPSSYVDGLSIDFKPLESNSGAATVNVYGDSGSLLGVKSILRTDGAALSGNDLRAGVPVTIKYNGTNFRLTSASSADATSSASSAAAAAASAMSASGSAATSSTQAGIATTQAGIATTQAGTATTQAGIATTKAAEASASADSAGASALSAGTSGATALNARDAAAASASSASTSESNALSHKNTASAQASAAAASAAAASASASAASTSASSASTSASTATTQASNASTSASSASTSATNASNSASSASTSATNASNSASAASTSATNASNSATSASNSASTATTQATNASNSASAASTSASNAAASASTASTQATNAANSASAAAASAAALPNGPSVGTGNCPQWNGSAWVGTDVGTGDMVKANNLSDLANAAAARTNIGLAIGTDVQAHDADLDWLAANITAAGKALLDDADAAAQRTTLGLGTAATLAAGTAANNLVQLDSSAKLPAVDGSALTNLPGGGSWVHLQTQVVSSPVASVSFTAGFSNTYSNYVLLVAGVRPQTTAAYLIAQLGTGGSPTWNTSGYYPCGYFTKAGGAVTAFYNNTGNMGHEITSSAVHINYGVSGTIYLYDARSASSRTYMVSDAAFGNTSGGDVTRCSTGTDLSVGAAFTAIRVLFNSPSSNIAVGTFSLYGIKKA